MEEEARERRVGSGLLVVEKQFRRVRAHKQIPLLPQALDTLAPKIAVVKKRKAS